MSTATDEAADLEESLDEDLPCRIGTCEAPAEWQMVCRYCRHRYSIYCTMHADAFKTVATIMSFAFRIECDGCGRIESDPADLLTEFPI